MQGFDRRRFVQAGAALTAASALPLQAQDLKPLRIIVPLPAGGVADASVRFFAEQWTALTRQTVTVDNRPGGNFLIGMQQLLSAAPDGNTWIHLNSGMTATQATFQRYDLNTQVTTLGMIGTTPGAIFVPADSPHQTVTDLLAWIRANPGKLNYGAIAGGTEHMIMATLLKKQGLTGTMIPFKGGPDACTALAQNEIQALITALPLVIPFKGKIKPLAVMTEERAAMTPNVPSHRDYRLDIPDLNYWGAFAVPAATPAATVQSLNKSIVETIRNAALVEKYLKQGLVPKSSSPEVMAKIIADELKWMAPVVTELNLKAG